MYKGENHMLENIKCLGHSTIKIKDKEYLFFEWKSGDYTCLGLTPSYYVLRKEADLRTDKTDLPFKNDKKAVGKWEAIDFVSDPDQFKPGEKYWKGE